MKINTFIITWGKTDGGGGAVSVSQKHRIFKISISLIFDFLMLDLSQNVAIYIVWSDEADGGVQLI